MTVFLSMLWWWTWQGLCNARSSSDHGLSAQKLRMQEASCQVQMLT